MPNFSAITLLFCATFLLASCDSGKAETRAFAKIKADQKIKTHSCEPYASVSTPYGDLQNNIWNAHAANDFLWEQCLASTEIDETTVYGWYWKWPHDGKVVFSQPQISIGYSPWLEHELSSENPSTDGFPILVDKLQKMDVAYDIKMDFVGELNLTSTLWLTSSPTISQSIDKSTIAVELMIWTFSSKGFYANPAGEKVADVTISGINWEVWLNKDWIDTSGVNKNKWTYIAFRSKRQLTKASFDVADMLKFSRDNHYINKDLYIADIQLGNEVMSGSGQAWVKQYSVNY